MEKRHAVPSSLLQTWSFQVLGGDNSETLEGCRGWAPGGRTGGAGLGPRIPACLLPSFQGLPSSRGSTPAFLHLPRFIPDDTGPLSLMPATTGPKQAKKLSASTSNYVKWAYWCNQIWLSTRINPKAPSDLMTLPHTRLSLTPCLAWWAALQPDVSWGAGTLQEEPKAELLPLPPGAPEAVPSGRASHFPTLSLDIWVQGKSSRDPSALKKWDAISNNVVCPKGQAREFGACECWATPPGRDS